VIDLNQFKAGAVDLLCKVFEREDSIEWVCCMIDDTLAGFYTDGVDEQSLNKCRHEIYDEAHARLESNFFRILLSRINVLRRKTTGHVYAVQIDGLVKVGRTINPHKRLNCIRTQIGKVVTNQFVSLPLENYGKVELAVHRRFAPLRQGGEWFNAGMDEIIAAIHEEAGATC
jgi:hypothetical protein